MPGQSMSQLGNLPTTIEAALVPSNESRIITEPDEPYRIIHVNEVWCRTCGFDAEEVLGQTCKFLHGPGTCGATLQMLKQALQLKRGLAVQLLNYTKKGRPFMNTLQVAPLYNSMGQVTHYLGVVMARYLDGGGVVPPTVQQMPANPPNQLTCRSDEPSAGGRLDVSLSTSGGQGAAGGGGGQCMLGCGLGGAASAASSYGGGGYGGGYGGGGGGYGGGGQFPMGGYGDSSGGHPGLVGHDELDGMLFGEGAYSGEGSPHGSRVPPFLTKLTEILTVEASEIVSLNSDAPTFTIFDPQRFAKEVCAGTGAMGGGADVRVGEGGGGMRGAVGRGG